jgi:hypothetical protein
MSGMNGQRAIEIRLCLARPKAEAIGMELRMCHYRQADRSMLFKPQASGKK